MTHEAKSGSVLVGTDEVPGYLFPVYELAVRACCGTFYGGHYNEEGRNLSRDLFVCLFYGSVYRESASADRPVNQHSEHKFAGSAFLCIFSC